MCFLYISFYVTGTLLSFIRKDVLVSPWSPHIDKATQQWMNQPAPKMQTVKKFGNHSARHISTQVTPTEFTRKEGAKHKGGVHLSFLSDFHYIHLHPLMI